MLTMEAVCHAAAMRKTPESASSKARQRTICFFSLSVRKSRLFFMCCSIAVVVGVGSRHALAEDVVRPDLIAEYDRDEAAGSDRHD